METGLISCWGKEKCDFEVPEDIKYSGSDIMSMSSGAFHTCIVQVYSTVRCWGRNEEGQATIPTELVNNNLEISHITLGSELSCVLIINQINHSNIKCWGSIDNFNKYFKDSKQIRQPLYLNVEIGLVHMCTINILGEVEC